MWNEIFNQDLNINEGIVISNEVSADYFLKTLHRTRSFNIFTTLQSCGNRLCLMN